MDLNLKKGKPLYQWDQGQILLFDFGTATPTTYEVQYTNEYSTEALVVETKVDSEGNYYSTIPNILLQKDVPITAFVLDITGSSSTSDSHYGVIYAKKFRIIGREKPGDYVYEETELIEISEIATELSNFINTTFENYKKENTNKFSTIDSEIAAAVTQEAADKEELETKIATKMKNFITKAPLYFNSEGSILSINLDDYYTKEEVNEFVEKHDTDISNLQTELTDLEGVVDTKAGNDTVSEINSRVIENTNQIKAEDDKIEEIRTIAAGKTKNLVFDTYSQLTKWLNGQYVRPDGIKKSDLKTGDNLLIIAENSADYWWDGDNNTIRELEVKVDLSNYYTKSDIDNSFVNKGSVVHQSGTILNYNHIYSAQYSDSKFQNKLKTSGDGTKFLADNGEFKEVTGGTTDYRKLVNVPRTLYTTAASSVLYTTIPNGVYDSASNFKIIGTDSESQYIDVHKGDIFAIDNGSDDYLVVFCVYGMYNIRPDTMEDWQTGTLINAEQVTSIYEDLDNKITTLSGVVNAAVFDVKINNKSIIPSTATIEDRDANINLDSSLEYDFDSNTLKVTQSTDDDALDLMFELGSIEPKVNNENKIFTNDSGKIYI